MKKKIYFEDHGQDFLWWIIDENGTVIDCGPFQASVWVDCKVLNNEIEIGEFVVFETKVGDIMELKYSIEKIEEL
ncbi:MAG: hypothetical protein A2W90_14495 [Bacteroidetes bacterium GWF2_42_66]|nr:MAG: hypothetical protein A2W92_15890 [Bacteroidetes bacterium GWA2_42_15]OFX99095.1 MAG: hypothetical protein A2W89_06765 [Bacteroidetes bacterium GWE2_42_39]OFY46736.1 MAG: hypothetical protein A2W90_14495 [Bacteroidetes bacterium GWF2_42_66]HAZ00683.1 hypothetical protein [Marinilabiliales bacterium]HBL73858.1 hypothetical protein [Prolixibacteraceae bacterium]